jgi:hypothetical protein
MTNRLLPVLTATALLCLPAAAQNGPGGIAFVQAPEQGGGVCIGATMDEAFGCAVAQCMEGGAADEDCIRTNWCEPAGWSVDIFAQHQEGPHWHEVVCGLGSENIAKSVGEAMCDREERDYLIECSVVQIYDPSGAEMMEW